MSAPSNNPPGESPGLQGSGNRRRRTFVILATAGCVLAAILVVEGAIIIARSTSDDEAASATSSRPERTTQQSASSVPPTISTMPTTAPTPTSAPASDGNGLLIGMKGTTPLVDLTKLGEFGDRLNAVNGAELADLNYGAESYDIVNILALSAEAASSDAPGAIASRIVDTTTGGEQCSDFAACKSILGKGGDIDYHGTSGPTDLLPNGDPAQGSYGVVGFNDVDELDVLTYRVALATEGDGFATDQPDPQAGPIADGVLRLGTVLPITGNLAFLGPSTVAGVKLAVQEVNDAGGVLGNPIELIEGDSGDKSSGLYATTVDSHIADGIDAMIGAASSGVTLSFLERAVQAGIIVFSPANTSKELSTYADKGLYYRLAPSDSLQGQALADLISEDGYTRVAVLHLQDGYGTALASDFQKSFEGAGGTIVAGGAISYSQDTADFEAEVGQALEASPDAILLIGFEETAKILKVLIASGNGPSSLPTYGVDGNMGNALIDALAAEG